MKREKCTYANKYKALRAPTCGCLLCEEKWARKQDEKVKIDGICKRA